MQFGACVLVTILWINLLVYMKLQLPSACAPVVLLEGQVPLILRLGPYHNGLCLFKPWTLCCMSSPLSLSLPSILSKNKGKPPPPIKKKKTVPNHYTASTFRGPSQTRSTPSPLNISEATSVALSLSDVTGCYSATGPIWHQRCCPPPCRLTQGLIASCSSRSFISLMMHISIQPWQRCREIWV